MKILWLSHFVPYPPKGGSYQRSFNMLKQLSSHAEVSLVALAPFAQLSAFYPDYEVGIKECEHELGKFCRTIDLIPHGRYKRKATKIINGFKSLISTEPYDVVCIKSKMLDLKLKSVLVADQFDAIHVDTIGLWPYVEKLELPHFLNHHNIESHMLKRRASLSRWPMSYYLKLQANKLAQLESIAIKNSTLNLTCSDIDTERLKKTGASNVYTIPNGVDLNYFTRKTPFTETSDIKLIFAGGLDWYPNHDAMVFFANQVWPMLKKQHSNAKMTVVGKGSINLLNEIAAKDPNFSITGFVPDVREYLEKASMYICPIKDGGGTKLKVLDALAMGVPLIAHPIACEGIDVVNEEHVLLAESPEEFCAAIYRLSKNPELGKRLSDNGRRLIEGKYCYDKIGEQLASLYQKFC